MLKPEQIRRKEDDYYERHTNFKTIVEASSEVAMCGRSYDKPAVYQICVDGILDEKWSNWFNGFTMDPQKDGTTILTGVVADQSALHGLLARLRDLGLPIITARRVEEGL